MADVVNLGYVINVVENPTERTQTLNAAWNLCRHVLVVSAQVLVNGRGQNPVEFGDGVLTCRGTFQKFYDQGELKSYLEEQLQAEAIPAAIGVFYIFRDESRLQQYVAGRFQRRVVSPRPRQAKQDFEQHRALLEPFMDAVVSLGRLPEAEEYAGAAELISRFGSLKRAFNLVQRETGTQTWEESAHRRREDLLVYLVLARFRRRPPPSLLPATLQRDMRVFFGGYAKACAEADALLFQAGEAAAIDGACRNSAVGKLLPDSLYVHRSALDDLRPLLRVYEGCAALTSGRSRELTSSSCIGTRGKSRTSSIPASRPTRTRRFFGALSFPSGPRNRQLRLLQQWQPPDPASERAFLHPQHPLYEKFGRPAASRKSTDSWKKRQPSVHATAG